MDQVVQVGGALLVLAALALAQARLVDAADARVPDPQFRRRSVLAVDAYAERQWGFLLLEGVWTVIAAWGLARPVLRVANAS